jgi:predicted DNA-binding WGR domain protein
MKMFYYMGHNPDNLSGASWKIWKIERHGRELVVWWGPAKIVNRRVVATNALQTKSWKFKSDEAAASAEKRRVEEKLSKGYEKTPQRRA